MNNHSVPIANPSLRERTARRSIFEQVSTFSGKIWQLSHWLSLNVVAGAVISSAAVCRLMGISPLPGVQLGVLGGAVWLIYTLDHLWDVRTMRGVPVSGRHFFHWLYFRPLLLLCLFTTVLLLLLTVLYLPEAVIRFGAGIMAGVAAYLWLAHRLPVTQARRWFHKELLVALLYTAGIWGSAWIHAENVQVVHWLLASLFFGIALKNLLVFSWYELEEDRVQAQRSVVQVWGKTRTRRIFYALLLPGLGAGLLTWHLSGETLIRIWLLVEGGMAVILVLLLSLPQYSLPCGRYRWIGDAVFMLPALVLIISG